MLRSARVMAGFSSIARAADFLANQGVKGVCNTSLTAYEASRRMPPADKMLAVLRAYGFDLVMRMMPVEDETLAVPDVDGEAGEDE